MEQLSLKWFMLCYLALGLLLTTGGTYLLIRLQLMTAYVTDQARYDKPPISWVKTIRYLFFFTLPCFVLSFFPFSLPELLFSVWCLVIVFTTGQMLAYWPQTSRLIQENPDRVPGKIRLIAANMISIGVIVFLLCYHLVTKGG